ncbi:50s ribosomal protein l9 [Lasius niger]|uniref:Large ribosomal subunit protein bL9m n=1 Tax=Lasius niger TaxID=67767 RepID=A0A0J7K3I6_LASNI|nr:50s ribosomal protein l9 [Lasius niger]
MAATEIILLERIEGLGQMGDTVKVRPGYARNFLLPQGKALRANAANKARFEQERQQLEADNLHRREEAENVAKNLEGLSVVVLRQAGESGSLYGSVSARDIADAITKDGGATVSRQQIILDQPIKSLGLTKVKVRLHPEVIILVTLNVARSAEEAERQARGEEATAKEEDENVLGDLQTQNRAEDEAAEAADLGIEGQEESTEEAPAE